MANILAAQNGNWSNSSTWTGGIIPSAGDNVYSNNRTVTIDTNIYCLKICNKAENGAMAGGGFNTIGDYTLDVDLFDTGATTLCQISSTASPTVYGQINGGTVATARGIDLLGTGTLTVNGFVSGGNIAVSSGTNFAEAIRISSTGNLILSGSAIGGVLTQNHAIHNFGGGNVTVYGDLSGSPTSTGNALRFHRGGNCTINGNLYGLGGTAFATASFLNDINIITINGNSYGPINNIGGGAGFSIGSYNSTTTVNGNIYGAQGPSTLTLAQNTYAAYFAQTTGTIDLYGDIYGGTGNQNSIRGLSVNTPATFNFVGNLYGGHSPLGVVNQSSKHALHILYCPNATLTCGVVSGGLNSLVGVRTFASNSYGLFVEGANTIVNLTVPELRNNNCINSPCVLVNHLASTLNLTSNIYDDYVFNQNSISLYVVGVFGTLNLTGSVYGKDINVSGITIDTARNNIALSQGTGGSVVNISGQIVGGITGIAVYSTSGNTFVTKVVGNRTGQTGIAGSQFSGYAYYGIGGLCKLIAEEVEAGLQGNFPVSGPMYLKDANSKITLKNYTDNNLTQRLTDPLSSSSTYPLSSDVRYGVSYAGGNLTGTCRVPLPQQVSYGTLVDNTSGSAILDASTLWNFNVSSIPLSGIGGRLKNCATSEIVASQIAAFFP